MTAERGPGALLMLNGTSSAGKTTGLSRRNDRVTTVLRPVQVGTVSKHHPTIGMRRNITEENLQMIGSTEVIGVLNRYPFSSRVMDAQVPSSRRPTIFLVR